MAPFDLEQVDRLLSTTRAVRKRLDLERPVEPAVITECLRLATFAPSAGNTQKWRWLVVDDAERRARIAAIVGELFYRDVKQAATSPDPAVRRIYGASRHLVDNLARVPALVIPCYLERPSLERGAVGPASLYGSVLQAVWSFQLALRSRGLGSTFTTMHLKEEAAVADLLGIPAEATQVCLIPVAYTIGEDFRPPPRRPVEDVTYWNQWGTEG
ncbi:MAG: nitroreductase family protein [Solirubrobacterales bacterium]